MLELPGLLIHPWKRACGEAIAVGAVRREVSDPATGQFLGFVQRREGFFTWLTGQAMEVYETEDASLVLTLHRSWGLSRTWEVVDAENRRVGTIYRHWLLDGSGQRLALAQPPVDSRPGRFVGADNSELGTFALGDDGILLTFNESLDPFTRMTLFGASLSFT